MHKYGHLNERVGYVDPPANRRSSGETNHLIHVRLAGSNQVTGDKLLYPGANLHRYPAKHRRPVVGRGKQRRQSPNGQWRLVIYLAGDTPVSLTALENLRRICQERLDSFFQIEVVDLLKRPEVVREEHIVAVPTVVRRRPLPVKRIFGDLTAVDAVVRSLEMPKSTAERKGSHNR